MLDFIKRVLIFLLSSLHEIFVYFMIIGFIVPYRYLYIFLLSWPSVYLHWQFNNNRCCLTQLEYYLKNIPEPPSIDKDHNYPFINKILNKFNIYLSHDKIHYCILYGLTICWIIGLLRFIYYLIYKK